jgi:hypothetical protein
MNTIKLLDEETMVRKGIKALIDTLGAVEANRFISMPQKNRTESVKRHREWQKGLDEREFLKKVFG